MARHFLLTFAIALAATGAGATAHAQTTFYAGAGTTGAAGGFSHTVSRHIGARVEVNALDYDVTFDADDAHYDATLSTDLVGAFVDYFPSAASSFRLTVGALSGERRVDLVGTREGGSVNINGASYNASGEHVTGTIEWPAASPYIGIGAGHKLGERGFSFIADLGVLYGRPKVTLTASPGLASAAGESNIDEERRRVQEEADRYKVYPVLRFAVGYAF